MSISSMELTCGGKREKREEEGGAQKKGYHTGYSHVVSNRNTKPASTRGTKKRSKKIK
jgi:hypothetical protein